MSNTVSFESPARPRIQIWRTILGIILIHIGFFATTFGMISLGAQALDIHPASVIRAQTPEATAIFFLTFLGYHFGLWFVVRFVHNRSYMSLFGPLERLIPSQFFGGFGVALLMVIGSMIVEQMLSPLLPYASDSVIERARDTDVWAKWLAIAVVLVFIQILAEELVFRGYLLQQLRARFNSIWLWAILPSVLFGALHFDYGSFGANAYFYVLHTSVVGIVLAIVTLRTGNLGAAVGLHFANNLSMVMVGNAGTLDGFSLFLAQADLKSAQMGQSIFIQTCMVVLLFAIWWFLTQRKGPIANHAQPD